MGVCKLWIGEAMFGSESIVQVRNITGISPTLVFDLLIKSCTKTKANVKSKRGFTDINTYKPDIVLLLKHMMKKGTTHKPNYPKRWLTNQNWN